jgi:hypothetical protein
LVGALRSAIEQDEVERERALPSFKKLALAAVGAGFLAGLLSILFFFVLSEAIHFREETRDWVQKTLEISGTFGDTFGMVNALISAVAFGGVLYTVYTQRKELALQREELRAARKEASRSADALKEQVLLSTQSARINGLSNICDFLSSTIGQGQTPRQREARGRRTWHAEQMEFYLSRLLTGELEVERREDGDFEREITRLFRLASTRWIDEGPPRDAPGAARPDQVTGILLYLAERMGALHYYAHPLSPAFQAIDQLQSDVDAVFNTPPDIESRVQVMCGAIDGILTRLEAVAQLATSRPLQRS